MITRSATTRSARAASTSTTPPSPASTPTPTPTMGYRPALDGLRAVAIALVLLEHTGLELFDGGNSGVIVFFVLSGFLITKLMLEEWSRTDTLDVAAFYGRRTVRIMPAPLVMVALLFALSWHLHPSPGDRRYLWVEILLAATYLTNLRPVLGGDGAVLGATLGEGGRAYLAHTWSLAVEEHFYLIWPWLVRGLRLPDRDPARLARALFGFAGAVTVVRFVLDRAVDADLVSISLFTFDGFALGAALAVVIHHDLWPRLRTALRNPALALGAALVLLVDLLGRDQREDGLSYGYWYITYIGLAATALIGAAYLGPDRGPLRRLLSLRPVVLVGKLSYSLYLWHVPVQTYISSERFPTWSTPRLIITEQVATAVVVLASHHLVEQPARRLRARFVPRH